MRVFSERRRKKGRGRTRLVSSRYHTGLPLLSSQDDNISVDLVAMLTLKLVDCTFTSKADLYVWQRLKFIQCNKYRYIVYFVLTCIPLEFLE